MKRILIALTCALVALLPAGAAHAQTPTTTAQTTKAQTTKAPKNVGVTGLWLGTNSGYENGVYKSGDVRYSITEVNGVALTGTKSWRMADGTWSEPEGFDGVLYRSGEFHAVDEDGMLIGRLISPTKIRATYLETGSDRAALVTVLTKASR